MATEKDCKPLNRVELSGEQSELSNAETEQYEGRDILDQISVDKIERRKAYYRNRWAMATDEAREKRNAYQRNRRSMAAAEEREKRKAYQRNRWAMLTDEEREKLYAHKRNRWAMPTDEEREKRKAYQRNRWAMLTDEEREKRNARYRELRANQIVDPSSGEKISRLKGEQREKQKMNVLESCVKASVDQGREKRDYEAVNRVELLDEGWEKRNAHYRELCASQIVEPSSGEKNSRSKGEQREKQKMNVFESCTKVGIDEGREKQDFEPLNRVELSGEQSEPSSEKRNVLDQISVDKLEKRKAYYRNRWAMATDEERQKRNAYQRKRRSMAADEERQKRNALVQESHNSSTVEQKWDKYKCIKREEENASSAENISNLKDEQKDQLKTNILKSSAKATVEEHDADWKYPFKIEQVDIKNASYLGSECIKFPDIVKKEQCSPHNVPLDPFEDREVWTTHVKIEYDAEE